MPWLLQLSRFFDSWCLLDFLYYFLRFCPAWNSIPNPSGDWLARYARNNYLVNEGLAQSARSGQGGGMGSGSAAAKDLGNGVSSVYVLVVTLKLLVWLASIIEACRPHSISSLATQRLGSAQLSYGEDPDDTSSSVPTHGTSSSGSNGTNCSDLCSRCCLCVSCCCGSPADSAAMSHFPRRRFVTVALPRLCVALYTGLGFTAYFSDNSDFMLGGISYSDRSIETVIVPVVFMVTAFGFFVVQAALCRKARQQPGLHNPSVMPTRPPAMHMIPQPQLQHPWAPPYQPSMADESQLQQSPECEMAAKGPSIDHDASVANAWYQSEVDNANVPHNNREQRMQPQAFNMLEQTQQFHEGGVEVEMLVHPSAAAVSFRDPAFASQVLSNASPQSTSAMCMSCECHPSIVQCLDCSELLCAQCNVDLHVDRMWHKRESMQGNLSDR